MALIKCTECGKEVSTQATACPHCGCPTTANSPSSLTAPSSPTEGQQPPAIPNTTQRKPSLIVILGGGFLAVMVLLAIIGSIFAPSSPSGGPDTVSTSSAPTRAEWRQKHPKALFTQAGRAALKNYLGEPSKTQRVGETEYWYYDCRDGSIQLVLSNPTMADFDLVVTAINDF